MADNLPIALRRTRRSNIGTASCSQPPVPRHDLKTPRKRVRFSDPGLAVGGNLSSGLTPMVSRISVATPKRRHSSTPTSTARAAIATSSPGLPPSGEVTFLPLRQVLDGRVQRRIRRNGMSEEMNTIQQERRRRAQQTKEEIDKLKAQLKEKDREIYEMQNATVVMDTDRVWNLERQVEDLKSELRRRAAGEANHQRSMNWTMDGRDLFADGFMGMEDDDFGDATMAQLHCSTPTRARSSFPTPPATSPTVPGSPLYHQDTIPTPQSHAGVQAAFPDPANELLEDELASLQLEIDKLTTTLDSYKALAGRLAKRLPKLESSSEDPRPAEDMLEDQVEALLRTMSDRTAALTHLTTCIADLGFPGSDAGDMITSLASGFRAARLELEYLTPGEIPLPLTSHGAEVLDLLLTRLRTMATKLKEDDEAIDEYHLIEQSLRKQLDARVSVMDGLKAEMAKADELLSEKNTRILDLEVANDRLKGAVNGYMRDIAELEGLVQKMESENRDAAATHHARLESNKRVLTSKENGIAALETKLNDALQRSSDLQREMNDMQEARDDHAAAMNRQHSEDLQQRDAKVAELRSEMDRVNETLRAAHDTIQSLRNENGELRHQMDEDANRAKSVIDAMKAELQRVLAMSQEFLDAPSSFRSGHFSGTKRSSEEASDESGGSLAKRGSKRMKKRYDSGLGFLEEDPVDV